MTASEKCLQSGVYVPVTADEFLQDAQLYLAKNIYDWPIAVWLAAFDCLAHARAIQPQGDNS